MESTPDPGLEHVSVRGALSPGLVGQRVVVRSRVPGEVGPTGGPAFTDVLGVLESWVRGTLAIRTESGALVEIEQALVVSGKPVPPRPSRFSRWSAAAVEHRCAFFSVPTESVEIGEWLLRFTAGANAFASAAYAAGDPGLPLVEAVEVVERFSRGHGTRPLVRVVVGSAVAEHLEAIGWAPLPAAATDNEVQLAGVSALARRLADIDTESVVFEPRITFDWLVGNARAQANYAGVAASLDLADAAFASISDDGRQVARVRVHLKDGWAFLADLTVPESHRRRGLARTMIAAATQWAAERGADVMVLQVAADNAAAQTLYADLGFERHHAYRFLAAPEETDGSTAETDGSTAESDGSTAETDGSTRVS